MGRAKQNAGSNISNLILPKSWYVMGKTKLKENTLEKRKYRKKNNNAGRLKRRQRNVYQSSSYLHETEGNGC